MRLIQLLIRNAACVLALVLAVCTAESATQTFTADDLREITNPERGLYQHYQTVGTQSPLNLPSVQNMRNNGMTLMLRLYYLDPFRTQPLSQAELNMISNDFDVMRQAGVKSVLRFAYNSAIGDDDASLSTVLGHMDQLAPIIGANSDVIATAQAGFVGSWGEWHASTNNLTDPVNARQITDKWLEILPSDRTIQIRTPALKKMITQDNSALTSGDAFMDTDKARIGHHNDCFLASSTDFGTYTNPTADKAWVGQETYFLPMGGETCAVSSRSDSTTARTEMQQLHFSYLNSGYHPDVLSDWDDDGFLDEVKRNLGYRFELTSLDFDQINYAGGAMSVTLDLENTGWASPFNQRDVVYTLVSGDGQTEYEFTLDEDPRTWLPGSTISLSSVLELPADAPTGLYSLWFSLPDPAAALADRSEYAIQLANPGLWDAATGRHDLGVAVAILAAIDGDLDLDGFVGIDDLNLVLGAWNQSVTAGNAQAGDPSGDGFVGIDDLNIVLGNWNAGTPPATDRPHIPEPSTLSLLSVIGLATLRRRAW